METVARIGVGAVLALRILVAIIAILAGRGSFESPRVVERSHSWTEWASPALALVLGAFLIISLVTDLGRWPDLYEYWWGAGLAALGLLGFVVSNVIGGAAFRALGRHTTPTIQIQEGHSVVSTGPYRYSRHPIFATMVAMCVTAAIALGSWLLLALGLLVALPFYRRRARIEEELLGKHLGEAYRTYQREVPFFWPWERG